MYFMGGVWGAGVPFPRTILPRNEKPPATPPPPKPPFFKFGSGGFFKQEARYPISENPPAPTHLHTSQAFPTLKIGRVSLLLHIGAKLAKLPKKCQNAPCWHIMNVPKRHAPLAPVLFRCQSTETKSLTNPAKPKWSTVFFLSISVLFHLCFRGWAISSSGSAYMPLICGRTRALQTLVKHRVWLPSCCTQPQSRTVPIFHAWVCRTLAGFGIRAMHQTPGQRTSAQISTFLNPV